ncbi:cypmaclein-like [Phragmites australis]|uniref:cypmaclein-like n=1 Tax=Phragmites australis TaxID=29695 RepID=UPI002D773C03|nr:cypmaclein-like [Phragmites australis]
MAKLRLLFSLSLVLFLLLVETTAPHGQAQAIGEYIAGGGCSYRCSKSGRPKMCLRACNTCCQRCGCVPPGTSGNENVCPCYANMITKNGKHKCP